MEPGGPRREAAALLGLRLTPPLTSPCVFQLSQEQGTGQQHVLPPSLHAQGRTWPDLPSRPPNPTLPKKLLLTPALAPQPWQLLLRGLPTLPSDVALTCPHSSGRRGTLAVGW